MVGSVQFSSVYFGNQSTTYKQNISGYFTYDHFNCGSAYNAYIHPPAWLRLATRSSGSSSSSADQMVAAGASISPTVTGHWTSDRLSSPVHGSCCRADCCCLLLKKRADQSASSSGGKGMWGGRRRMTSYFCCLLLSLLTGKSVSPTAGGETGARGDSQGDSD